MIALYIVLGLLAALIAVLLIRTAAFKPKGAEKAEPEEVEIDKDRAVDNFRDMLRCRTISSRGAQYVDETQFEKFRELLKERYPLVHANCEMKRIGPSGILYHLKGQSAEHPSVFMSHYDVVPVDEEAWEKPPFDAVLEDGVLWGRGTLDTKITLLGTLESAESLLARSFVPKNDIYFSFSGDEEIAGDSAPSIVSYLEENGITPAFVLDEGGAVVEDVFPGVKGSCALIGTGEKGMIDLKFVLEGNGGHASSPPPHTLIGKLAKMCVKIEKKPFKSRLTAPVAEMFDTLGRHSTFVYRMIFANLWLFKPVLDMLCKKKGGELNALMRTTCAFTRMKGSPTCNVLPNKASMVANLRLIGGDTVESAIERLGEIADNEDIKIGLIDGMNPSPFSRTDTEGWQALTAAINGTWPEALVSPYLMVACSDSRHFCRISDSVYRFSAMALTSEERASIHGHNERIKVENIYRTVEFYTRLMSRM